MATSLRRMGGPGRAVVLIVMLILNSLGVQPARAQSTTLQAGDLAVIGLNSDGPGRVVLLALADLPGGTVVKLTDHSWTGSGFTNALGLDGTITWTATSAIAAGTVVTITTTTLAPATFTASTGTLSASGWTTTRQGAWGGNFGDSVLVYQGPEASPTFVYAFTNRSDKLNRDSVTGFYTAATPNQTVLPAGLSSGVTALSRSGGSDHLDNLCYAGPRTGTRAALLAAIGNRANWTGNGGLGSTPLNFVTTCGAHELFLPLIVR